MSLDFIIIGAGAAGLSSAIYAAKDGHSVRIYDKLHHFIQNDEDSYPIGLNPRGINVLKDLDPDLVLYSFIKNETPIEGWSIYQAGNDKPFVNFESGTTIGATRGGVVYQLYEYAKKFDNIKFFLNQKLMTFDIENKTLEFEDQDSKEINEVDASDSRIIASDGVWSKVRRETHQYLINLGKEELSPQGEIHNWGSSFRLLFSRDNPDTLLNPTRHHIFSGLYVAVVKNDIKKWVVSLQINENTKEKFLLSEDDNEENIDSLKNYVQNKSPLVLKLINSKSKNNDDDENNEAEYHHFFQRRTFSGAVVIPNKLNYDEFILFLGDSAHSVNPATGEGINSALEDAYIFKQTLEQNKKNDYNNLFQKYNDIRLHDVQCLSKYAKYLLDGWNANPTERLARTCTTIGLQLGKKLGIVGETWNDKSFGSSADKVTPYSVIYKTFQKQTRLLLPFNRLLCKIIVPLWSIRYLLLIFVSAVIAKIFIYPLLSSLI
eukprot:TRINITY_DN4150_c0_g1_i1.p1 TRINITY_DN4150_c0_g1~~TRINITY_DN4150_c0_g1_i1.p1  ORF type:complete len:489 (+),score=135.81 TRINITY_DN4150_c0_g1_i1:24-1490(+)